ncbi:hypothetical protein HPG69_016647 [Diceros bicornis minor]|uniref:Ankyrin repeat domain-containing protein 60 n=1 Tax=Diceros bicornis minor TaxID=77932 RepID=A0A7J7FGJ4_DICBM|nr:hypothetical protein HPG69_016647 [Diceros bicornis minor]
MRRAAAGAAGGGGARAARPAGGAPRPDPAGGPQPLPAQPPARTRGGDPPAASPALDVAPDVFVVRVLLEETGEMFRVTDCRSDMTVRELKEELDLMAGIPFNLQRLQYLDQGANCLSKSPVGRTPLHVAAAMGQSDCIDLLLSHGASINDKDAKGETPMSIARRLHREHGERRMFLHYWKAKSRTAAPTDLIMRKFFRGVRSGFGSKKKNRT